MSYQCLSVLRTLCQVNLSSPKFPRLLGQGGLVPHDLRHQAAKVTLLEPSPLPRKTKAYTNLPKLIEGTKINFCITCQNQLSTKGNTCVTLCAIFFTPFTYVTYISLTNNIKWFKLNGAVFFVNTCKGMKVSLSNRCLAKCTHLNVTYSTKNC